MANSSEDQLEFAVYELERDNCSVSGRQEQTECTVNVSLCMRLGVRR